MLYYIVITVFTFSSCGQLIAHGVDPSADKIKQHKERAMESKNKVVDQKKENGNRELMEEMSELLDDCGNIYKKIRDSNEAYDIFARSINLNFHSDLETLEEWFPEGATHEETKESLKKALRFISFKTSGARTLNCEVEKFRTRLSALNRYGFINRTLLSMLLQ